MKKSPAFVLAAFICLIVSTSVLAGPAEEFAAFDRAYVPALALTNQGDKPQAAVEESMRRLVPAWDTLIRTINSNDRHAKAFDRAIRLSGAKLTEATGLVATGKRKEAHGALEVVRLEFWKARTEAGIIYLPDRFTAFHEPMEEFVELAAKPETDREDLRKRSQQLSDLWRDVEETGLDEKLFGVSPERAAKYGEQVRREREILTQLMAVVGSPDKQTFSKTLALLKGNFAQTYFIFGDFSGL